MKKLFPQFFLILFLTVLVSGAYAQKDKSKRASPPATVKKKVNGVTITIDYSQPSKKGRLIWDGLVKYGQVWRTGANEATTFEISANMKVEGQMLRTGKYALFTIPGKEKWTIIFNSVPGQWGAYKYDEGKDVLRVDVKPSYGNKMVEKFTIDISDKGVVSLKWDDAVVKFTTA